jgi:hypothetical protein
MRVDRSLFFASKSARKFQEYYVFTQIGAMPPLSREELQQRIPRRPLLQVQVAGQRRQTRVSRDRHNLPQGQPRVVEMGGQRFTSGEAPPTPKSAAWR